MVYELIGDVLLPCLISVSPHNRRQVALLYRTARGNGLWQLVPSAPQNVGDEAGRDGDSDPKLAGNVVGQSRVAKHRIEDPLDKKIVSGMQNHARPHAAGFEAHQGGNEAVADDLRAETQNRKPKRAAAAVIGAEDDRHMV